MSHCLDHPVTYRMTYIILMMITLLDFTCVANAALFNYDGVSGSGHLSLTVGDLLYVLEEQSGWLRGYLYYQPSQIVSPMASVWPS